MCSGTARRKRVIALAREGTDASSYVRRWTLLGSMLNSSSTHTRVILVALLVKYPELLSLISESRQFKHEFKASKIRALHEIKEMWERNELQAFTDKRLSQYVYQPVINLTTHMWDEDMEETVRLVLLGGAKMCKWQFVATILDMQAQELMAMGLQSSTYIVSTTLDI
jgi:hypothetical protein